MSENYQPDVKLDENPNGTVSFATEVVATIAGLAVTEVDGVASMSSSNTGFADMFSRKNSARNFTKGVRIDLDGNKVTVDVTIIVEYGSPVPEVARGIQENVKKAIETMTGLDVHVIDVHIAGISFAREQRTTAELNEQQLKILKGSEAKDAASEAEPAEEVAEAEEPAAEAAPEAESSEETAEAEEPTEEEAEEDEEEFEAEDEETEEAAESSEPEA